jgi:hypothetical protein
MDAEHRPDYPPKTPPPPKRPVEPPRPSTVDRTDWRTVAMRNRRGSAWVLENAPWTPGKAGKRVVEQLHTWGYGSPTLDTMAAEVTILLVRTAVDAGGRRVSLHLADQDRQALVMVLSSPRADLAAADGAVLPAVAALGATSCGVDAGEDGRRLWAVLDV